MGHKVNPVGFRLGIHRKWKSNWFFESKNYANFIHLNLNIERFFKGFLYFYGIKTLLIKCQLIKLASNKIFIFIFYYRVRKKSKRKIFKWRLKKWKKNLEQYFNLNNITKHSLNHFTAKYSRSFLKKLKKQLNNDFYNFLNINYTQFVFPLLYKKKVHKFFWKKILTTHQELLHFLKQKHFFFKKISPEIALLILKKLKFKLSYTKLIVKYLSHAIKPYSLKSSLRSRRFLKLQVLEKFAINFDSLSTVLFNNDFSVNSLTSQELTEKSVLEDNIFSKCSENLTYNVKLFNKLSITKKHIFKIKYFYKHFLYSQKLNSLTNSSRKIYIKKPIAVKKCKNLIKTKKKYFCSIKDAKHFLSRLTNCKMNLIFINALSFAKFFYMISDKKKISKIPQRLNILRIQRIMVNKYKYNAIFIKDFVHLAFLGALFKTPECLVKFIAVQFKRLPKNRRQLKLLNFINQTLKIFCLQRKEFLGFRLQIKGRLNRRTRTKKWRFQRGILSLQTTKTRIEYAYTEGYTKSGLIGIKLWFFYKKMFKKQFKKKMIQYLYYSQFKTFLNKKLPPRRFVQFHSFLQPTYSLDAETKSTKISKK